MVDPVEETAIRRGFFNPLWLDSCHGSKENLRGLHDIIEDDISGLAVLHFATRRHNSVAVRAREAVEVSLVATQSTRRMYHRSLSTREHHVVIVTLLQFSDIVEETGNETLANLAQKKREQKNR